MLPALCVALERERIPDVYLSETEISLLCSDDDSIDMLLAHVYCLFYFLFIFNIYF